jgi:hypothetical protein
VVPSNPVEVVPSNTVDVVPSNPVEVVPSNPVEVVPSNPVEVVPSNPVELVPTNPVEVVPSTSFESVPLVTSTPVKSVPIGVSVTSGELIPSNSDSHNPDKQSITFMDILKVPVLLAKPKSKRSEESQHLTSSPYKQSLEEEIVQKKANLAQKKRKTKSSGNKPKKAKKAAPRHKKTTKANTDDAECPICGELWSKSMPGEDWVTCMPLSFVSFVLIYKSCKIIVVIKIIFLPRV